jgi:hypothetical protein
MRSGCVRFKSAEVCVFSELREGYQEDLRGGRASNLRRSVQLNATSPSRGKGNASGFFLTLLGGAFGLAFSLAFLLIVLLVFLLPGGFAV